MKRTLLAFALFGAIIGASAFSLGKPPIAISLNPHVGFAPLDINGYVTIQADSRNRGACIVYNSDQFISQSCKDLDGDKQLVNNPVHQVVPLAGTYDISATLFRNDGKMIQSNIERIQVLSATGGSSDRDDDRHVRNTR